MVLPRPSRGLVRHAPTVASQAPSDPAPAAPTHARWFSAPETIDRCLSVDQGLLRGMTPRHQATTSCDEHASVLILVDNPGAVFTSEQVMRLTGVSRRRLTYWLDHGIVSAEVDEARGADISGCGPSPTC